LLVAALCAACGGGGESKTAQRARAASARDAVVARAQPISTQAAPATKSTTTTTAAPRRVPGFADGEPAPHVIDRGGDYVAIARSLVAYGRWLQWHDPDPALVDRAYEQLSDLAKSMAKTVVQLHNRRERIEEVVRAPLAFKVMSVLPRAVSFQLTEKLARRDRVSATGRVVDHVGAVTEQYIVIMMRAYSYSPWRLFVFEHPDMPFDVKP
jgi:hypothetical protein